MLEMEFVVFVRRAHRLIFLLRDISQPLCHFADQGQIDIHVMSATAQICDHAFRRRVRHTVGQR